MIRREQERSEKRGRLKTSTFVFHFSDIFAVTYEFHESIREKVQNMIFDFSAKVANKVWNKIANQYNR